MSEFLETHRESAEDLLDEALPFLLAGKLDYAGLLRVCENYRIRGIVHILLDGRPDGLQVNLRNAGRAFLRGLASLSPSQIVVSRALPLFDAAASNDFTGAAAIARALPPDWKRDLEYEDDQLYVTLVAKWITSAPERERDEVLARLAAVADDADPRLAAMGALSKRDGAAFDVAVDDVASAYQRRLKLFVQGGKLSDEAADTLPYFCAEGLALIRLAEREGLSPRAEHALVPETVRRDYQIFDDDGWQRVR